VLEVGDGRLSRGGSVGVVGKGYGRGWFGLIFFPMDRFLIGTSIVDS
jgi:hypothetical protein